jgi:tRNA threonylcarbamoyl adenosine modification protein YjeE
MSEVLKIKKFDLSALPFVADQVVKKLPKKAVIFLEGELGIGKTSLVRMIAKSDEVQSPSFAIHNYYSGEPEIHHFDLYRISSLEELQNTGFFDLITQNQGWVFVEWPQLLNVNDFANHAEVFRVSLKHHQSHSDHRDLIMTKLL